jgi:urea transport system permease protein
VVVTLFAPKGIGGLFDLLVRKPEADRDGDYGPDAGSRRSEEGPEDQEARP